MKITQTFKRFFSRIGLLATFCALGSWAQSQELDSFEAELWNKSCDAMSLDFQQDPVELQIKAKMWEYSVACDTNNSLMIELGSETKCVATQLMSYDRDQSGDWVEQEISVFVKEVMKMPLFAKAIAKEIVKRFDINKNATLEFTETEELVNGLEKPK